MQDHVLGGEDSDVMFPYIPPPTTYVAPSASSINGEAGHLVNGSSMQAKSNNSDDELEELNSPLALISIDQCQPFRGPTKLNWLSKQRGHQDALRYELLRDTWRSSH
ncbi:hypothetical protein MLD38_000305 [Melastoma candidum]|uniref:Uncharacterized protein n=1 Tax=Melastoma candidum TaxID=119954 RepID=A0ACB9SDK4_9MYRT|nr:hypothetical protein MLD38_000305 [Melastoma candidum]